MLKSYYLDPDFNSQKQTIIKINFAKKQFMVGIVHQRILIPTFENWISSLL